MLFSLVDPKTIDAMIETARGTPPGCFVEVGVYQGGTAQHLAKLAEEQSRQIFLYDTFTGIPYQGEHDLIQCGTFEDTSFEQVANAIPYATIVRGIFPESAVRLAVEMGPISFIHLDCDQYQSYKDSLHFLIPRCQPGTVIWFDDYGCLPGADKAIHEIFHPEQLLLHNTGRKTFVRL